MTATIPRPRSRVRVAREEYELSPKTVSGVIEAAPTQAWDADLVQQVGQHPAVVALPWCDDNREGSSAPADGVVDRCREPTARTPEAVTCRFTGFVGRILDSPDPPCVVLREGGVRHVLMGAVDRGVHRHRPRKHPQHTAQTSRQG